MEKNKSQLAWQRYLETDLPIITKIIGKYNFTLEEEQPHIKGERFLMQAITTSGGKKIILYGRNSNNEKVVIKATRDRMGKEEIKHERNCRKLLHELNFAYDIFHSAKELKYIEESGFCIIINEFIDQTSTFLDRTIEEQFNYSLQALKAQESARATTAKHIRTIKKTFNYRTSFDYLNLHAGFLNFIKQNNVSKSVIDLMEKSQSLLENSSERIEQYCGFLTHTDFVPHNFRIKNNTLYLLDFSSLQFGNKHESWARFLNFMTLYNSELESLLINYVENNRAPEERESLQLMRIFRLGEIITYYVKNVAKSEGSLQELNQNRVQFWADVLTSELENKRVERRIVEGYKIVRDKLRSADEKKRQIGLH